MPLGGWNNGVRHSKDVLQARANVKNNKYKDVYGPVVGICDDIFIIARLSKALSCAAEMKKILKADLDMDLNVPKFNVSFPDTSFSLDTA